MKKKEIISCKAAAKLMSLSCERRLTLREQVALKSHLAVCETCRYCQKQIKGLQKILPRYLKAVQSHLPPPELSLSSAAQQRIIQNLKAAGA